MGDDQLMINFLLKKDKTPAKLGGIKNNGATRRDSIETNVSLVLF